MYIYIHNIRIIQVFRNGTIMLLTWCIFKIVQINCNFDINYGCCYRVATMAQNQQELGQRQQEIGQGRGKNRLSGNTSYLRPLVKETLPK